MLCLLASWRRTLPATPSIRALRGLQAAGRRMLRVAQRQAGSLSSEGASDVTHRCAACPQGPASTWGAGLQQAGCTAPHTAISGAYQDAQEARTGIM